MSCLIKHYFYKQVLNLITFTDFYMSSYDPLLSEFYVQNNKLIGNFPRIDFFMSMLKSNKLEFI